MSWGFQPILPAAAQLQSEPPSTGPTLKHWAGSAWVLKPLKWWNGSVWVNTGVLKRWDGTSWVAA
ncbi:hypothetical protein [Hydrogenophaga defluvii]|uniref:YXWGXW repeat-containing protein n=1 Tax=Hydrogenophaga defluvii TaxID=249410 RepID=A0ABW2SBD5_9BURK